MTRHQHSCGRVHDCDAAVSPRPAAPQKCAGRIFPSWANQWVNCGSPIVQGRCARYGHLAETVAEPAPDAMHADCIEQGCGSVAGCYPEPCRLDHPAAPDATAGDGLREALEVALHRRESGCEWDGCSSCRARAQTALDVFRDVTAARDAEFRWRVEAVLAEFDRAPLLVGPDAADRIREALDPS